MKKETFEKTMKWMLRIIVVEIILLVLVLITLGAVYIANVIEDNKTTSVKDNYVQSEKETNRKPIANKSSYTEEDVELLARLIHGEARGECYEGQVAVGAVVLNRVKSKGFPNTIEGVIYQKNQFSCLNDGQFDLPIPEGSSVYEAARDALEGEDPTNGCTYFYNPELSTSRWIFENTVTKIVIGDHHFAVEK